MLAKENPAIDEAVTKIYTLTEEDRIREQMEAREEYYRIEQARERRMKNYEKQVEEMQQDLSEKDRSLAEKDNLIAQLRSELASLKTP